MLNFMPTGKVGGDCTCPYSVTSDTPLTVAELVQQILTRKEWGNISFYYRKIEWGTSISTAQYSETQLNNVDDTFVKIQEKSVIKIRACGGWTRMDYDVLIEED